MWLLPGPVAGCVREGPACAGPSVCSVVPVCVQVIWSQIVRFSTMRLCSRSVRTLGEQALGVKKGLFLNNRRCREKGNGLEIYVLDRLDFTLHFISFPCFSFRFIRPSL